MSFLPSFSMSLKIVFTFATITLAKTSKPSYQLLDSTFADGNIPIQRYRMTKSSIEIILAETEGPIVQGCFFLATKEYNDNGSPHALEHLIFLGSEDYPYKGALDLIANRCYSDGLNAYTSIDHTAYTTSHAGIDGFLLLLPVYLDHILYSTITPSGYKTEVHHIDGNGMDGGVVYSEMLGSTTFHGKCFDKLAKILYPKSAYKAFTGGAVRSLRENTTIELIRDCHEKYYRPENLLIFVSGDVQIDKIVNAISKFEKKILSKSKRPPFVRPWQKPVGYFNSTVADVLYPSADDGISNVYIAWRGPNCVTDHRKLIACDILLAYLCSGIPGSVKKGFTDDKLAISVSRGLEKHAASTLYLKFSGVLVENRDLVYPRLKNIFRNISTGKIKIDLDYIRRSIGLEITAYLADLESSPHITLRNMIVRYFIYGKKSKDLRQILNLQRQLRYLLTVGEKYWISILNKYFTNTKYVQVNGILSKYERDRADQAEADRIEKQIQSLGATGLIEMGKELAEAIKFNSVPVPDYLIKSIPTPVVRKLNYHHLDFYRTGDYRFPPGLNLNEWSVYAEAYDIKSNFVYIEASMFTHNVDSALRQYLNLLLTLIFKSPIQREDVKISSANQDSDMEVETSRIGISASGLFGSGSYSQTASIMLKVEKKRYKSGANLIKDLLQNTVFSVNTIKSVASQLLNSISGYLSNGKTCARDLLKSILYKSDSNFKLNSALHQDKFLTSVLNKLDDPTEALHVIDDLNVLRDSLSSPENLGIHIAADWAELNHLQIDVNSPWDGFGGSGSKKLKVVPDWKVMHDPEKITTHGEVVGLDGTQSAFLHHASPGIGDYNDPDLPALYVALRYCTQTEGPMWRRIRGPGYVYGSSLYASPNERLIHFTLFRASNVLDAFNETVNIINELTAPNAVWETTLLEGAKNSATFAAVNKVMSVGDLPHSAFLSSFENKSNDYIQNLVQKIAAVTVRDVKRVAKLYLTKIFSKNAKTIVVCNLADADEIAEGMKIYGLNLPVRESLDDSLLSKF